MPDDASTGPWIFDAETLLALRLEKAHRALEERKPHQALVEAEELLEEDPLHLGALAVVGRAGLEMGDAMLAAEAFERLVDADPNAIEPRIGLAAARFETVDFPTSLALANQVVAAAPDRAEGWYYRGLCQQRLGDAAGALVSLQRAHAAAPEGYPLPKSVGARTWRVVLKSALASLPGPVRSFYGPVPFQWESLPETSRLLATDPPTSPFISLLLQGAPAEEGDPWTQRPDRAVLFRENLNWPPGNVDTLIWRLRQALLAEAIHWLGIEDTEDWLANSPPPP